MTQQIASIGIGRVAQRAKISTSLVRKYEKLGLVLPSRESSGFRLFSESDVKWIQSMIGAFRSRKSSPLLLAAFLRYIPKDEIRASAALQPCKIASGSDICWSVAQHKWKMRETCRNCPVYNSKAAMLECNKYFVVQVRRGVTLPNHLDR